METSSLPSLSRAALDHEAVAAVVRRIGADRAVALWTGISDAGCASTDPIALAVALTCPAEARTALDRAGESAAAFALGRLAAHIPASAWAPGARQPTAEAARAWADLVARAESAATLAEGFGWDLSEAFAHERDLGDADAREQVRAIAALAGRMTVALRAASRRKVSGLVGEVHGVEQGGRLRRLLRTERGRLSHPGFRTLQLDKIARKRALQYSVRVREPVSKGALVLCVDESGSMHDHSPGKGRNTWAKAACVALARAAHERGRPVVVVHYSTQTLAARIEPGDGVGLLAMIRHFYSGGNWTPTALARAAREVEALESDGEAADVVLITDGVEPDTTTADEADAANANWGQPKGAPCHADAVAALGTLGAKLWTVAIECEIPATATIRAQAAGYTEVGRDALASGESVLDLAGAL
jgi:hypothetical protein